MKKKLLNSMRMLLVAAGLTAGANVWGQTTYDTVWEEDIARVCTDWNKGTTTTGGTVTLTDNGSYKNVSVTVDESTHDFNTNLAVKVGRPKQFMVRYAVSGSGYNAGFYYNWNATSTVAVLNAKKDYLITIRTTSNSVLTASNATANSESATSYAHEFTLNGTKTITYYENTYTVTADGTVTFTIPNYAYVGYVGVKKIHEEGTCDDPSYSITGANGNARTFTLSCATEGSTIYYSTTELASATGGTEYTAAVETEEETIWAYAKTDEATSDVISFSTGAGSTLTLATPAIAASGFTNTDGNSVNNPTFSFTCNNSGIIGKPTATLSYTFTPDGGVESEATTASSFAPAQYGTLKVIASADGYNPSEKSLVVSSLYTISYTGRDYSTANKTDISDEANWGTDYDTEGWSGWQSGLTANLLTPALTDDYHLNIQNTGTISLVNGWGFVRGDGNTYGYRARYAKEGSFIAFKENTSKGSDATATTYQTAYCSSGSGVITDLVTITVPAWYALQQLYQYTASPLQISVTLPTSGYGSLASAYGLDFSSVDGLTAYVATATTTEAVTLTAVDELPANSGVILKGTAGATYSIPVKAAAAYDGTNLLGAAVTAYDCTENEVYILQGGKFHLVTAASTVPAGKAYLPASAVSGAARALSFVFSDDETTGISATLMNSEESTMSNVFDLQGRRVVAPQKGLYIMNGKKVIIK